MTTKTYFNNWLKNYFSYFIGLIMGMICFKVNNILLGLFLSIMIGIILIIISYEVKI